MIGTTEALIIGGVVLLLFGAKKLPELAKSMGQSKAAFDEGLKEGTWDEEDSDDSESDMPPPPPELDDEEDDDGDSGGGHDDSLHSNFGGGFG